MTLCGAEARDVTLFLRYRLITQENTVAWEASRIAADDIKVRYPRMVVVPGNLHDLPTARGWHNHFPFDVINLDFTDRALGVNEREWPQQLDTLRQICGLQRSAVRSFGLFLTANGTYERGSDRPDEIVMAVLDDAAKRLSDPVPLFRVVRDGLEKEYHLALLDAVPLVVIRIGFECGFDTQCSARWWYVPWNGKKHPPMVTFRFQFAWLNMPLSEPTVRTSTRLVERLALRQGDALSLAPRRL
jgi:hypothetical protein